MLPNNTLQVDLHNLYLDFDKPGPILGIEGYNDFGTVVEGIGNTLTAIIRNRVESLVNE